MAATNERTLTLLHLRKTFGEYMRVPLTGAREVDPNRLMPLFSKVMSMYTPAELKVEFKELIHFSSYLSSVLVREIRQRAASQGTEEAASSIAEYLQPGTTHKGWLLLLAVHFLISADDDELMDSACKVSLPSTLVKAVYLFFDLPPNEELRDPREKLNQLLTSLLDKMCTYRCVSEELAKKDDLLLLFVGASSVLPECNVMWRKTSARILETLSAKAITPVIIKYVHTKECISTYIGNMKNDKLSAQETAEMIISLLCVLKDSARHTMTLLNDFSHANGYIVIKEFLLKNENDEELVKNILLMLISEITSGPHELLPQYSSGLIELPSFQLPTPGGNGLSVRNPHSFSLLYQVFLESQNPKVCATVIDVVHSIYTCDFANYFILDKEYPLCIFVEQIEKKDEVVRSKILELVELCVFQLNHIPCKELISICVIMKTESASGKVDMSIAAVQSAFRLLTVDSIMKDAFREVGLLDTLCYILNNLLTQYKKRALTESESKLTLLATDLLTVVIKGNLENAKMFTDCFGARSLLPLLTGVQGEWRSSALQLLKQLLLLAFTDQYIFGVVQVFSHSNPQEQLDLNTDLLKTVLGVLRESHKVRVQFRKTGGYLSLISMLLGMEGVFSPLSDIVGCVPKEQTTLLDFIHLIFKVLTISMRFEPSNAKYFSVDVSWDSITAVLRLTGAFVESTTVDVEKPEWKVQSSSLKDHLSACHSVFKMDEDIQLGTIPAGMPPSIFFASYIIRLLFNMALDNYEKMSSDVTWTSSEGSLEECIVSWTSSVLVHPGAVQSILSLLPSIHATDEQWTVAAQYYCTLLLKALLKPERNQQLMCQVDMPRHLLSIASRLFLCEEHLLLGPFYYLLERLSYQAMQPCQLRNFLRLDLPLCCRNLDSDSSEEPFRQDEGGPVPLQRVKALVSMMTPRDQRLSHAPSFIELDMALEGFGALFVPCLAPLFTPNRTERVFPPLNGFTFATWLYIDSLSDKKADPHPLRLLTITRTVSFQDERKKQGPFHLACLTIQLSSVDRSLLISTEELDNPGGDLEKDSRFSSDKLIRVALADILRPMEWMHLTVVLTRSVLKPCQATVYVNGRQVACQKLQYIIQTAGGAATQLAHTHAVNAVIGTLPAMRRPSRLRFRIASTFLMEEPLQVETVRALYHLQPHYIGNLQTAGLEGGPLVPEEKIVFSLNGTATSELTLAKIRGLHSKLDAEILAPHLGISAQDNSTPLRIMMNTAGPAPGPGRSFGAVVVGYLGMRSFTPRPVPRLLDSMGGYACLYGLVAMATDSEGLYASLKAVVSAVRSNTNLQSTLHVNRAYQTLAVLLEDKANLLNSHIMHMVFSMTGTLDTTREVATIPIAQAFEDLLCDLDVWSKAPEELHRMLYEHFYELITDHHKENLSIVRRSPLLSRLLFSLFDHPSLLWTTNEIVFNLLSAIVQPQCDNRSMMKLGQAIAATLPTRPDELAAEANLPFHISELQTELMSQKPEEGRPSTLYLVYVRNRMLNMLANFLSHSSPALNQHMSEQLVRVLGFDWLLSLVSEGLHSGTVFLALRLLLALLSHSSLLVKFRDGTGNGGWLADADSVVRNRAAVVLGFSVSAHGGAVGSKIDINPEMQRCGGFAALEHLMAAHADKPHAYLAMLSLLVGQPVKDLRFCEQFNMDQVWTHVFGLSLSSSVYEAINNAEFCYDALIPLFAMIRAAVYEENQSLNNWSVAYPSVVLQMLTFLYQNSSNFFVAAHSDEFVLALFSSLVQDTNAMGIRSEAADRKEAGTPELERAKETLEVSAVRGVLDFLKKLFCDDFQIASAGRVDSLIDTLIENVAENGSTRKTQMVMLTSLIHSVLDHLVGTDLLISSALPPNMPPQSLAQVGINISYMASRAVDVLWNGVLIGDPQRLLQSFYHLHAIASRKDNKSISLDSLTSSIMRTILFILSRPIDSVPVQMCVLDTLSSVVSKRYILLASNEAWFFTSLTHLVFMLSVTPDILEQENVPLERASAQVAICAARVWTDLICAKKALLEETFKRAIVSELNAARALLAHAAGVQWSMFVDSQLHQTSQVVSKAGDLQQQISSKITKVASGLTKLASKRTLSSHVSMVTSSPWKNISVDKEVINLWLRVHVSLVKELVSAQAARYHEWHAHVRKWTLHEWHQLEAELTRERGIWGPEKASKLDKYKLDVTEGPSRIRRKLIPNRLFYHLYPYRPHLDEPANKAMRAKVAISRDSELYYNACSQRRARTMDLRIVDHSAAVSTPSDEKPSFTFCDLAQLNSSLIRRLSARPSSDALLEKKEEKEENKEDSEERENGVEEDGTEKDSSAEVDQQEEQSTSSNDKQAVESRDDERKEDDKKKRGPDNQTLLRLLEQGEQLHSMFRCARVQGLETSEGLLLFGREHYYVVDGFTLLKTREIRDLDFLSQELHDPIVPYTATGATTPPKASRLCSKFSYEDIKEVHKRRYLLQPIALEVFSGDGRNYLLAFPKKMRDRVYEKLVSMAKGLTAGGTESVGGQKANMAIEQSGRVSLLNSLIGQQSVTQRWLNGQISNFQYLMHLNTLAGRSYNDLSQYPVFPWVLADYHSMTLDFTNPKTFRDFSKSMGAQSGERLEQFLKRYREWDDPTGETPPYMYGTHYSSAMIVVSYLVRLEPFTQQFLCLQGGHFDLADRMFHSFGDAWTSASKNNMADVKELIPEFFTLPELLVNKNRFDLGVKQSGVALDDVILPAWARGDPREFIRLHRQALECDYVSAHLHEWIDLIFGYKQNGEEAIKANNLYHHLFYEGNVDFESINDPLTRNATIGFVNNFGQIPAQLFKKPHPQKKVSPVDGYGNTPGVTTQRLFYHSLHSLKPPQMPIKELRSAVGSIWQTERAGLVALEQNRVLVGQNRYVAWGFPDRSLRLGQVDSDKSTCIYEMCDADELTCVASGDERTLFSGNSTGCVSVWTLSRKPAGMKRRKVLDGHSDAVTCLVVCAAHAFVVSASRDCSVLVWHQSELSLIRQLPLHPSPVSAVAVNETTGDIATACSTLLHVWSINGDLLAVLNTCDTSPSMDASQMILSLSFSTMNEWDCDNVIMCGSSDGVVKIYSCIMVENDGSVGEPQIQHSSRRSGTAASTVHARLERQRRRLRVGDRQDTASSEGHSPEPPQSPAISISGDREGADTSTQENGTKADRQYVRVLMQRAALTMHTAFNRPDNTHPAPITVIAPSKDHKCLYVGDGIGRVWCWQGGEDGGRADHWVQDLARQRCTQCQHKFSIADRKHHCRNCGQIFCAKCSRFESHITHMKISRPVRVCQNCYLRLRSQAPS